MTWYGLMTVDGYLAFEADRMEQHNNGSITRILEGRAVKTWAVGEWSSMTELPGAPRQGRDSIVGLCFAALLVIIFHAKGIYI